MDLYIQEKLSSGKDVVIVIENLKECGADGGTRLMPYETVDDMKEEATRLAVAMKYKAAFLGVPFGGAKAVINISSGPMQPQDWIEYSNILNRLGGKFTTGMDIGMTMDDVTELSQYTKYVKEIGSATATAQVLVDCMRVVGYHYLGTWPPSTVAIQGIGKVGSLVAQLLHAFGTKVIACDANASKQYEWSHMGWEWVDWPDIYSMKADVFVPCAVGGILNSSTIPQLQASMIIGSANCQLASEEDYLLLMDYEKKWIPDFVCNSGGLCELAIAQGYLPPYAIGWVSRNLAELCETSYAEDLDLYAVAKRWAQRNFKRP